MTDINEIGQRLSDHIKREASENWPGAVILAVVDGSPQWTEGYVWCDLGGSTVRCIVPATVDLTGGSQVIYGIPIGNGASADYLFVGVSWNGADNSRIPRIRAATITDIDGDPIGGGTTDHGALDGLADDDHSQYHNDTRGDARYVQKSLFDAQTLLAATTDDTPAALTVNEQTLVGRVTGGNVAAIAIDGDLSSVSANDDTIPSAKATKAYADTKIASSLFDANTILAANADDTPLAVGIAEDRVVGRLSGGSIDDLTGAQVTAILSDMVGDSGAGGTKGLVPAPGAGDAAAGKYLKASGTWAVPPGSGGSSTPVQVNLINNASFDVWENGTALAPDAWTLTGASASVARSTTTKTGLYSAAVTRSGTDCHLSQNVYIPYGSTYIRSREVTLGAWVYATVADRCRLRITDGVDTSYSDYHAGDSAWAFLTVTFTPGGAVTELKVGGAVDTGNTTGYFDGFTLIEGSALSYCSPGIVPFSALPMRAFVPAISEIWSKAATYYYTTALMGMVMYQTSPADGDYWTFSVWLRAGTYTLYTCGAVADSAPKLDYYCDGVVQTTGEDWYGGYTVSNTVKSFTLTVVGDGYHVIKAIVNGKNGSSSNYYHSHSARWIVPSAD